jgi:hypothetical protein
MQVNRRFPLSRSDPIKIGATSLLQVAVAFRQRADGDKDQQHDRGEPVVADRQQKSPYQPDAAGHGQSGSRGTDQDENAEPQKKRQRAQPPLDDAIDGRAEDEEKGGDHGHRDGVDVLGQPT